MTKVINIAVHYCFYNIVGILLFIVVPPECTSGTSDTRVISLPHVTHLIYLTNKEMSAAYRTSIQDHLKSLFAFGFIATPASVAISWRIEVFIRHK